MAAQVDFASELPAIVRATRVAVLTFAAALVLTVVAAIFDANANAQVVFQWAATLAFVVAWAASYSGIYKREENWWRGACFSAIKWWGGIFVPVAAINLFFSFANSSASSVG
ncbi:hypothetical protein [Pseudonocardia sp.]|uniref:hypothetical protein n=1 Tax=Pseudonocardia sp. TaxID=60912 RepID=UPI003D0D9725